MTTMKQFITKQCMNFFYYRHESWVYIVYIWKMLLKGLELQKCKLMAKCSDKGGGQIKNKMCYDC